MRKRIKRNLEKICSELQDKFPSSEIYLEPKGVAIIVELNNNTSCIFNNSISHDHAFIYIYPNGCFMDNYYYGKFIAINSEYYDMFSSVKELHKIECDTNSKLIRLEGVFQ